MAYNVTIANGDTSTNGSYSDGDPDTFTPTGDDAVAAADNILNDVFFDTPVLITTGSGGAQAGDITVNIPGSSGNAFTSPITLEAAGSIVLESAFQFNGNPISLQAGVSIAGPGEIDAGSLTLSAAGGGVSLTNASNYIVTLTGLTADGDASLTDSHALTVSGAANVGAHNLALTTVTGDLTLSAPVTAGAAILTAQAGAVNDSTTVAVSTSLTVSAANASTFSGAISGAGSLTQEGAGTLTLSSANAYTGGTTVTNGATLVAGHADGGNDVDSLGTGQIILAGGELTFHTGGSSGLLQSIAVNAGGDTIDGGAAGVILDGALTGSGPLSLLAESGTQIILGTNNTGLTGAVTIAGAGVVAAEDAAALTAANAVTVLSGATLEEDFPFALSIGSLSGAGQVRGFGVASSTLTVGGDGSSTSFSGVISNEMGTLSLTKVGAGVQTLTGANTYVGGTTISDGTLQIGHGGTTGSITGDVADNATLEFSRTDATTFGGVISGSGAVKVDSGGTLTLSNTNAYSGGTTVSGGATLIDGHLGAGGVHDGLGSGPLTLDNGTIGFTGNGYFDSNPTTIGAGGGAISVGASASVQIGAAISGSGELTLAAGASGLLVFDVADPLFTGSVTVDGAGLVIANVTGAFGASNTITVDTGARFGLGESQTIGSLSGAGAVSSATDGFAGPVTLTVEGLGADSTYSGVISDKDPADPTAVTLGVTKVGSGAQTLTGASTYTGATTVEGGALVVDGAGTIASSATTVSGGSLGGTGTVGAVTVASGGTLSPGDFVAFIGSAVGHLTTGAVTLASGAHLAEQLSGTTAAAYDQVLASGNMNLGGATLDLTLASGFAPAVGSSFDIIHLTSGTLSGQFAQGSSITVGGVTLSITYTATDVMLSVPAPPPPSGGGTAPATTDIGTPSNDTLVANAGGDTVLGGNGDDNITGSSGHDILYGNAGNDVITIGAVSDSSTVFGGMGNDVVDLTGSTHANFVSGDLGDDLLKGGAGADTMYGGDGNDTLVAGSGNGQLYGNAGNDHITFTASSGASTVFAGQGDDTIDASQSTHSNFISADLGNDFIHAGAGADTVYAGDGADSILAGSGHDQLYGNAGSDYINIGAVNQGSTVYGGQGGDVIDASTSTHANYISGDAGTDIILTGTGADTIHSGEGSDTIMAASGSTAQIHVGLSDSSALAGQGQSELDHVNGFGSGDKLVFDGDVAASTANTTFHGGDSTIANFAAAYAYAYGSGSTAGAVSGATEYAVVSDSAGHVYVFAADHAAVELDGLAGGVNGISVGQILGA